MINGLSNYILCFLIIFSNIATVVYVYPLFLKYILLYELQNIYSLQDLGLYLGVLFCSYELSKLLSTYFWIKASTYIGHTFCINISLISLAILNLLFSYTTGFYSALFIRILIGSMNNIGSLSKIYFFEIFPVDDHLNIIQTSSIFANLSTVIGFIIGGLIPIKEKAIDYIYVGQFSFGLNQFFISSWLMSSVNLFTLIMNLIKSKCDIKKSRLSIVHENLKIQIKDTVSKEKVKDNFSLNSIASIKKPSLVLFETVNRKETLSKNIDQIIDKDFNIEDYSSKRIESLEKRKNDSSDNIKKNDMETKTNEYGNIIINNNFNTNYYDHSSKNYIQIQNNPQNESKLNTSNIVTNNVILTNLDGCKASARHMNSSDLENYNNKVVNNKLVFATDNNFQGQKMKFDENNEKSKIIINNKFNSDKFQEIVISESHEKNCENTQKEIDQKKQTINQEDYSHAFNKSVKSKNLISNLNIEEKAFKISVIYTSCNISENIIYNFFYCCLFAKTVFGFDYFSLSIIFIILHLLYAILFGFVRSKLLKEYSKNDKAHVIKVFRILLIISLVITIIFPVCIIFKFFNFTVNLIITCLLFILRNLTVSLSMTCYNNLINIMDNNKIKEKINSFNTYFTATLKIIFCFLTYILSYLFLEKNLNYSLFICFFAGIIFLLALNYIKSLDEEA